MIFKNGNITELYRKGLVIANNTMDVIDDLDYQYLPFSNKLAAVHDMSDRDEGFKDGLNAINNINDYLYDSNGNMISDLNKEISLITYNHLNLPERIEMNQGVIEYFYDASGVKQQKRVTYPNNDFSETLYAGGFVYSQTQATTLLHDFDFYFTPEGYAKKENGVLSYVYQYKDHLGNVRLSYKDNNGVLEIIEENNYYPFGLKHQGYNAVISSGGNSTAQKYQYNGKEWQDELGLNFYDYGWRNYDASIGRWMNIDPLAEDYHFYSGYHFSSNNPVLYLEVDGKYYVDAEGRRVDISLNDDGKLQLGDNATADLIELVNYANSSGSEDSIALILQGGLNKSMIHIKVEKEEIDNGLFGLHQAHDKDGNVLEWDREKKDFNGTPEYVDGEEGVYKEATITIFVGNIKASSQGPKKFGNSQKFGYRLSLEQAAAATFAHEVNHNTDEEFIIDLKNRREQNPNKGIDPHTNITPNEVRIWSQMHNSNDKKN